MSLLPELQYGPATEVKSSLYVKVALPVVGYKSEVAVSYQLM
jgi:hypothetical protein